MNDQVLVKNRKKISISSNLILLIILIFIILLLSIVSRDNFLSYINIIYMLKNMVIGGLIAIALTPLMITRNVDISFGSSLSLATVVMALLYRSGINLWITLLAGVTLTTLVGFINGFTITKFNLNPLIFTIAMMSILLSLAMVLTEISIPMFPEELYWFGSAKFLQVPLLIWLLLLWGLLYWVVMKFTGVGRRIYAIGGNPTVSRLYGIKVNNIKIALNTFFGLGVGIASIVMISLSGAGNPYHGLYMPIPILSAVVLGGVSFMSAGKGSILGTVLGLLIVYSLFNGLSGIGMHSFYIQVVQGLVLISVVAAYEIKDRNKRKDTSG